MSNSGHYYTSSGFACFATTTIGIGDFKCSSVDLSGFDTLLEFYFQHDYSAVSSTLCLTHCCLLPFTCQSILAEGDISASQRRAASEGLGLLARLGNDIFTARLVSDIFMWRLHLLSLWYIIASLVTG